MKIEVARFVIQLRWSSKLGEVLKVFYNEDKKVILILNRRTDSLVQNHYTLLIFSATEVLRTSSPKRRLFDLSLSPERKNLPFRGPQLELILVGITRNNQPRGRDSNHGSCDPRKERALSDWTMLHESGGGLGIQRPFLKSCLGHYALNSSMCGWRNRLLIKSFSKSSQLNLLKDHYEISYNLPHLKNSLTMSSLSQFHLDKVVKFDSLHLRFPKWMT